MAIVRLLCNGEIRILDCAKLERRHKQCVEDIAKEGTDILRRVKKQRKKQSEQGGVCRDV